MCHIMPIYNFEEEFWKAETKEKMKTTYLDCLYSYETFINWRPFQKSVPLVHRSFKINSRKQGVG